MHYLCTVALERAMNKERLLKKRMGILKMVQKVSEKPVRGS